MDALRLQLPWAQRHLFSIPALYFSVSRYGSSVGTALRMLLLLLVLHFCVSLALSSSPSELEVPSHVLDTALHSARLMLYQTEGPAPEQRAGQLWADLVFRLLGTAQLAMLVLAFRAKVKRS
jgi:hypothetical protein